MRDLRASPFPESCPSLPLHSTIWVWLFFSHLAVNSHMNPSQLCSQDMEAAFQHYQFVTKNLSLTLKVENDILKAKIIKFLIVSHCWNGRVHVLAWRNTPTLLSLSPPGAPTSTSTTGVNPVNCRESWSGITLNPCGISQTKAGDAHMKQHTQRAVFRMKHSS